MDEQILTSRLRLRPWAAADVPALLAACRDPEVLRWTSLPDPYTLSDATAWCRDVAPALWAGGTGAPYAVLGRDSAVLLGSVGLHRLGGGQAEVGYWCAAPARGAGVTSEALRALCRAAFRSGAVERLSWYAEVGNWASRAVAEKCGFAVEGLRRRELVHRGVRVDAWVGSLLPGDLPDDEQPVGHLTAGYLTAGHLPAGEQPVGHPTGRHLPAGDQSVVDVRLDRRPLPRPPVLRGDRVVLRPFRSEDAPAVAEACDDAGTARWLTIPSPYTLSDGRRYVGTTVPQGWAQGSAASLAVVDPTDDRLLGAVGLSLGLRSEGVGEVGFWVAPPARGRGVARDAARLMSGWGLTALGLSRVELLADVDNTPSRRAAQAAGFDREGVLRAARPDPRTGVRRDMVLYSRISGES